jgi:TRAP-type C4-dicarboxylate transport system permease small subunit
MAAFAFFAMMWLIDVNALSRKLLNAPVTGTLEITEALMVVAILLPMAYAQMTRSHIRVTLLTKHLSVGAQRALYTVALFLGFVFAVWAAWAAFGFFLRSYSVDEHAWGTVRFPIYPSKGAVALGMALLAIQFLLDTIRVGVFGIGVVEEWDEGEADAKLIADSDEMSRSGDRG